jgi:hypothetical protein
MNSRLKKVKDGTGAIHRNEVVWFDVRTNITDATTRKESGEIYWPFALVYNCTSSSDHAFDLVHLPSGFYVFSDGRPRRRALGLVRKLRSSPHCWEFTTPKGTKWEAAKALYRSVVARKP